MCRFPIFMRLKIDLIFRIDPTKKIPKIYDVAVVVLLRILFLLRACADAGVSCAHRKVCSYA